MAPGTGTPAWADRSPGSAGSTEGDLTVFAPVRSFRATAAMRNGYAALATAALGTAVLLAVAHVAAAAALVASVPSYRAHLRSTHDLSQAIALYDWTVVPILGASLLALAVNGRWLRQARLLIDRVEPRYRHRRSPGWSWFAWIVPIVAWVVPLQFVRDMWRASHPRSRHDPPWAWWWALWIALNVLPGIADRAAHGVYADATAPGGVRDALGPAVVLEALAAVAGVGALVLWWRIVRGIVEGLRAAVATAESTWAAGATPPT